MCLDDALLPAVARDRLGLDGRWPEPRALDQADVFFLLDRTRAVGFNPALPGDFRDVIVHRQLIE